AIYDKVSQPAANTVRRWTAADLNGDGRSDFVSFIQQANQVSALSLIAQPDGRYSSVLYPLGTFENPSLATWRVADVNRDGRADLVHVQCLDPTVSQACSLLAQSFLSRGDGTFVRGTQSQPLSAPGAAPAALVATRVADVDGDGRTDIVQPVMFLD